ARHQHRGRLRQGSCEGRRDGRERSRQRVHAARRRDPGEEHHRRRARGPRDLGAGRGERSRFLRCEDHLQLLGGASRDAVGRDGAHVESGCRVAVCAVLPSDVTSAAVRIAIWHGYLLAGTGSNVYTRALAREWSLAGHDVTVVCQERHPERYDLGGARVVVPELPDRLLPVFVLDDYDGLVPRLLQDFTRAQREAYVTTNAKAIPDADVLFANHVLLGGAVGAASSRRYAVKAHGSELEYSMRGRPELEEWGARSLEDAVAVFVGSEHIRRVLEEVVGHVARVHEIPPGVDVDEFHPAPRDEALAALIDEARRDPDDGDERHPDPGNAE